MAHSLPVSTKSLRLIIDSITSLPNPELTSLVIFPSNRFHISIVFFPVCLHLFPNALMGMKSKFLLHGILSPTRSGPREAHPPFPSLNIHACPRWASSFVTLFCCDCNPPWVQSPPHGWIPLTIPIPQLIGHHFREAFLDPST